MLDGTHPFIIFLAVVLFVACILQEVHKVREKRKQKDATAKNR